MALLIYAAFVFDLWKEEEDESHFLLSCSAVVQQTGDGGTQVMYSTRKGFS